MAFNKFPRGHRRAAIRLMHRLGGYQSGRTFLIEHGALVRALEAIAAGRAVSLRKPGAESAWAFALKKRAAHSKRGA